MYKETVAHYYIQNRLVQFPEYSDSKFIVGYDDLFDSINDILCINFDADGLVGLYAVSIDASTVIYKISYL